MAVLFALGSSLKYGCVNTSLAEGLLAGFRESREMSREEPAVVRKGNLARRTEPVVWWVLLLGGRRRDFALGRRRKDGQVVSVGMPQSSKILVGLGLYEV